MPLPVMTIRFVARPTTKVLSTIVAGILGASCAASDPPPTSPLGDTSTAPAFTGTPFPLPTFNAPAPATPSADGTSVPADQEQMIGSAIDALAGWIGIPATDITFASITAVDWPDGCLGAARADEACDSAITPGYNIRLALTSRPEPAYEIHSDLAGRLVWNAGFFGVPRVIENYDATTGVLTLERLPGSDEMGAKHRVVPGSYIAPRLHLAPGVEVHIAITYALPGEDAGLVVWIVPAS